MPYFTAAQRYDVIVVGDVATDVIIRMGDRRVHRRIDDEGSWLELPLGEKIPIEKDVTVAAGGTAANSAVSLARLELRVALATFLAHDHVGLELVTALHTEEVDTRLVHIDTPAHTNRNFVLSFDGERTILVRDSAFNYHWPYLRPSEVPAWIYVTSVGSGGLEYLDQIAEWLQSEPKVQLAFHPGTFQVATSPERLSRLYRRSEILVCNAAQASELTGLRASDLAHLLKALQDLGSRQVVICDEFGGGVGWDGARAYRLPRFPDASPPFDRTGATDAFTATVVGGLVRGLPLTEALRWAAVNFMSDSHELGSQSGLLRASDIANELADVGDSFAVETL